MLVGNRLCQSYHGARSLMTLVCVIMLGGVNGELFTQQFLSPYYYAQALAEETCNLCQPPIHGKATDLYTLCGNRCVIGEPIALRLNCIQRSLRLHLPHAIYRKFSRYTAYLLTATVLLQYDLNYIIYCSPTFICLYYLIQSKFAL